MKITNSKNRKTAQWNPTTGCSYVSVGCRNCYAKKDSFKFKAMHDPKYQNGFKVTIHEEALDEPSSYKEPHILLVSNISDLFHYEVPLGFIQKVFKVMNNNPQHIFRVLTKRARRLAKIQNELKWTDNIWMGVTVENEGSINRAELLKTVPAKIKYIACEPLMGPLNKLNLDGIDWVIIGGETGKPNARALQLSWVTKLHDDCKKSGVKFYFKQWGSSNQTENGRNLFGQEHNEIPS